MGKIRDLLEELGQLAPILTERRVVLTRRPDGTTRFDWEHESPFKEGDRLTVYHGFREFNSALLAAKHGLSGKDVVARNYSYEQDNNPKGVFVTLDFQSSKEFVGAYGHGVIMEFDAKYSELEAPVWPGGSYTVQGQKSQAFGHGREGRIGREKARQADRQDASKPNRETPSVSKSDRPEVAARLLSSEFQALFVGHLNPDRIRAFWVRKTNERGYQSTADTFKRYKLANFIKEFGGKELDDKQTRNLPTGNRSMDRVLKPQDEWNPEKFVKKLAADRGADISPDEVVKVIKSFASTPEKARQFGDRYVWPKQMPGFIRWAVKLAKSE